MSAKQKGVFLLCKKPEGINRFFAINRYTNIIYLAIPIFCLIYRDENISLLGDLMKRKFSKFSKQNSNTNKNKDFNCIMYIQKRT